jgi:dTDP-4-amino-4,6-dideoxygalactose transaminase
MIEFYKKRIITKEIYEKYLQKINIDFRQECNNYIIDSFLYPNFYLTKSCTQSLELSLMILNLEPGSEIILPSFAFVSIANAISLRNLKCVFVDCEADTMNIDTDSIEAAISEKTKAVVCINYGGIACNFERLMEICKKNDLILIEDNAHGILAKYKNQWLGSLGDISTISFDFMKNISCNEGGGIVINDSKYIDDFKTAYELGSNKRDFIDGKTPYYEWKSLGSNHLLAEPLAAILYSQLSDSENIIETIKQKWEIYYRLLKPLEQIKILGLAKIPPYSSSNGHIFWIKTKGKEERAELILFLKKNEISTAFHYTPLHKSEFGNKIGTFRGEDKNTSKESDKLLRLPIYYDLEDLEIHFVVSKIFEFYKIPFIG